MSLEKFKEAYQRWTREAEVFTWETAALFGYKLGLERAREIAKERARIMNVLGCDAKMTRKLTNAEVQGERVLEAWEIERQIQAEIEECDSK